MRLPGCGWLGGSGWLAVAGWLAVTGWLWLAAAVWLVGAIRGVAGCGPRFVVSPTRANGLLLDPARTFEGNHFLLVLKSTPA